MSLLSFHSIIASGKARIGFRGNVHAGHPGCRISDSTSHSIELMAPSFEPSSLSIPVSVILPQDWDWPSFYAFHLRPALTGNFIKNTLVPSLLSSENFSTAYPSCHSCAMPWEAFIELKAGGKSSWTLRYILKCLEHSNGGPYLNKKRLCSIRKRWPGSRSIFFLNGRWKKSALLMVVERAPRRRLPDETSTGEHNSITRVATETMKYGPSPPRTAQQYKETSKPASIT